MAGDSSALKLRRPGHSDKNHLLYMRIELGLSPQGIHNGCQGGSESCIFAESVTVAHTTHQKFTDDCTASAKNDRSHSAGMRNEVDDHAAHRSPTVLFYDLELNLESPQLLANQCPYGPFHMSIRSMSMTPAGLSGSIDRGELIEDPGDPDFEPVLLCNDRLFGLDLRGVLGDPSTS